MYGCVFDFSLKWFVISPSGDKVTNVWLPLVKMYFAIFVSKYKNVFCSNVFYYNSNFQNIR